MDDSGNTKDDLKLPTGTEEADKLAEQIQKEFNDGKELVVTVLKVRGCLGIMRVRACFENLPTPP